MGGKRLLVLAGAALITPAENPPFKRRFMLFMTKLIAPKVVETSRRVFDLLLHNKDLHWATCTENPYTPGTPRSTRPVYTRDPGRPVGLCAFADHASAHPLRGERLAGR